MSPDRTIAYPGRRRWSGEAAIAGLLFLLALAFQLPVFDRWGGFTDEGRVLQTAAELLRGKVLYRDVIMPDPGPAAFYLLAWLFRLTGPSFGVARAAVAILSSAMAALLYLMARSAMSRCPALLVGLAFISWRQWAFPHWHFYNYSSCALFFHALAYALLLGRDGGRGLGVPVLAGAAAGVATLAKQDIGLLGLVGLGVSVLVLRRGARGVSSLGALVAGALAVALPVLVCFAAAGALAPLYDQAVRTPFLGRVAPLPGWHHLRMPSLLPLFTQDHALRALFSEYAPPILSGLYLEPIMRSASYRDTALWDISIKACYYLPFPILAGGALLVVRQWRASAAETAERLRAERAVVLVIMAAGALAAFNPPRDWYHLSALYHPTLVVAALLLDRGVERLRPRVRRAALGLATVGVLAALLGTAVLTQALRRTYDRAVATPAGTVWLGQHEGQVLEDLLRYVAARSRAEDPLPVFPYYPLVQFLAGRSAGTDSFFVWPVRPRDDTDARLIANLDAARPPIIVYSPSQYPHLRLFQDNAPDLFTYLVDHYEIVHTFTVPTSWGLVFCALAPRSAPPPSVDLAASLERATVRVSGPQGTRVLMGEARAGAVGRALWPFHRVVYERPTHGGTTTIALPLTIRPRSRLRFGYGVNPDRWFMLPPAAVTFAVGVMPAGGEERRLFAATVDPTRHAADRTWRQADVDLGEFGGSTVVLTFETSTDSPVGERSDIAGWAEPGLVVGSAAEAERLSTVAARAERSPERDAEEIQEHAGRVAPQADLGAGDVSPVDRHLHHPVAELEREHEDLDVEGIAVDRLAGKDRPRRLGAEQLEAALRVADARRRKQVREEVEDAPDCVAVPQLAHSRAGSGERARADGNVGALVDGGEQAREVVDPRGPVGVGVEQKPAARIRHAQAHRGALATVTARAQHPDRRVQTGELVAQVRGGVRAPVVDQQDLVGAEGALEVVPSSDQGGGEPALLVERGDDERNPHRILRRCRGEADLRELLVDGAGHCLRRGPVRRLSQVGTPEFTPRCMAQTAHTLRNISPRVIFDWPNFRSMKTIGTSASRNPRRNARYLTSIRKE